MKAGIYNGIKQIEMKELPRPTAGDNDAEIGRASCRERV